MQDSSELRDLESCRGVRELSDQRVEEKTVGVQHRVVRTDRTGAQVEGMRGGKFGKFFASHRIVVREEVFRRERQKERSGNGQRHPRGNVQNFERRRLDGRRNQVIHATTTHSIVNILF